MELFKVAAIIDCAAGIKCDGVYGAVGKETLMDVAFGNSCNG